MFGYFFRYFIARASYDAVRAGTLHRIAKAKAERLADLRDPKRKSRRRTFTVVLAVLVFIFLYIFSRNGRNIDAGHAQTTTQMSPSVDSAPVPLRALPVHTPVPVLRATVPRAGSSVESAPPSSLNFALPPVAAATGQSYTVVNVAGGDTLNVRSGPGSNNGITAKLPKGYAHIRIVGAPVMNGTTEWVNISFGGRSGWVTSQFLKSEQ